MAGHRKARDEDEVASGGLMRNGLVVEELQKSLEREFQQCMGFTSTAAETKPTVNLTMAQLQRTMHQVTALSTVYYIACEAVPQIGEEGEDVYFVIADELARKWLGFKIAGLLIIHPNLLLRAQELVTRSGMRFEEWQYDLKIHGKTFRPYGEKGRGTSGGKGKGQQEENIRRGSRAPAYQMEGGGNDAESNGGKRPTS